MLTKKGTIRQRKPKNTNKENKQLAISKKHLIRSSCNATKCRLLCNNKIDEEQRKHVNKEFWTMDWMQQKVFILAHCSREVVKRRTTNGESQRNMSVKYHLPDRNGEKLVVCKVFFLTTLGYHEKNDGVVFRVINQTSRRSIIPTIDRRGRHPSTKKIDRDSIVNHIEPFHPVSSHYRREHAPLVRYLPSDVTINFMHTDFTNKHPNITVSYDLYRKVLGELNIHFTRLGHEECETCESFNKHDSNHSSEALDDDCNCCNIWARHRAKYMLARKMYQQNSQMTFSSSAVCVSVDMQKVIMLPRMEQFKRAIFTRRLSVYHESFVPVGKHQSSRKPFAAVWHEAISGRNKEDLISAYYAFFLYYRDVETITIWMDNCSAQNKNWCFLSFIVHVVNSNAVKVKKIELNYFEPGHTYMSADSFHHQVEKSLKHQKKTYDFRDFLQAVGNSGKAVVKEMKIVDFYNWKDHHYVQKKVSVHLSDIVQIMAERGNTVLKYRTSFDSCFLELNFIKKSSLKTIFNLPECKQTPAGISKDVKEGIVKKLGPMMPENRVTFWKDLKEKET